MVASEHLVVIEGRLWLIDMDILDHDESAKDGVVDDGGTDLNEDNYSDLKEVVLRTGVAASKTEEVEEARQTVKAISLSYYMLKCPYFLTQGFKDNKKSQVKLFYSMCNYGTRSEWRSRIRYMFSYLDV